jgi:restriction system protein
MGNFGDPQRRPFLSPREELAPPLHQQRRREQWLEAARLQQEAEDRRREQEREAARVRERVARLQQEEAERQREREERRKRDIMDFMSRHGSALAKKRWQLTKRDAYGNVVTTKLEKEKRYFICKSLVPYLVERGYRSSSPYNPELDPMHRSYEALVEGAATRADAHRGSDIAAVTTGLEYEHFCAKRLTECGWTATVTQASGDQGVDIIARHGDLLAVFQCKFYTQDPVRNKAVQEAVAGRLHERADVAVVITNSTYTLSAEELARTTGTILIHHDDISRLREIIRKRAST